MLGNLGGRPVASMDQLRVAIALTCLFVTVVVNRKQLFGPGYRKIHVAAAG
jgi:hypothetical protein